LQSQNNKKITDLNALTNTCICLYDIISL